MEKHTQQFKAAQANFKRADEAFDAKPCRKTAKKLAAARAILKGLTQQEKYTKEFRAQQDKEFTDRLTALAQIGKAANLLDLGMISAQQFARCCETTDDQFPHLR